MVSEIRKAGHELVSPVFLDAHSEFIGGSSELNNLQPSQPHNPTVQYPLAKSSLMEAVSLSGHQQGLRKQHSPAKEGGSKKATSQLISNHTESESKKIQFSNLPAIIIVSLFSISIITALLLFARGNPTASVFSRRIFGGVSTTSNKVMSTSTGGDPMVAQPYKLLQKTKLSPNSYLLQYEILGRSILGNSPQIPTCIKVDYPDGTDAKTGEKKTLSKSYSPVSHPSTPNTFDLIVKSYPLQPGGGVGKFICDMNVGDSIVGTLKKERVMHGSTEVEGRWNHVGLIAGGTGIAPLLQIARILLDSPQDVNTKIHLLFINTKKEDILGKSIIDQMAQDHPNNFFVTYALTGEEDESYEMGRGTVEMAQKALPAPSLDKVMVLVCGKDGFVAHWAGPVTRGPKKPDGSKGPKVQGPLEGILKEAGYSAEQVFKY